MMRRTLILAAVLAAGLSLGGSAVREGQSAHPAERAFADAVAEGQLRGMVKDLVALGPRMGGTPSGDRAAAYVERRFREMRLETQIVEDGPRLAHWEDGWSVEVLPSADRLSSAWPMGFSPSVTPPKTGVLSIVSALAAVSSETNWDGRVIYTPGGVGRAYEAVARGGHPPLAILTSAGADETHYVEWSRLGELPSRADNPVPVFSVSYRDGQALERAAARGASVRISLTSTVRNGSPRTVVATLPGESDEYYLVCAHGDSDSGGPGADDNASGVATVLEIARIYSTLMAQGKLPRPRYSLRFAVWGSEYASSGAYIRREGDRLARLRGVVNFDETGTGAERETIYFESNDVPWNATLLRTLERVGADYLGKPGFWPEFTTNPSQGGTDSYAFLPRQYKGTGTTTLHIPATTIYTAAWDKTATMRQTPGWHSPGLKDPANLMIDYSRYYHSSGDTPENTTEREPQNMVRAVKAAGLGLLRLAWTE